VKVVLGVSGGIAAYKAPELVRRLQDAGAEVRVLLTPNAARFVSPLSLAAVSNHAVVTDQWGDSGSGGVDHIELARWADVLLIAPATANILAKLAVGIADDALSTYALAHRGAIAVAPAMNTFMLAHPTVQQNIRTLVGRGVHVIEPVEGLLACGDEGAGRMPDPELIASRLAVLSAPRDLVGRRVLVTAGPTREPIDPVRYLTNRSSGKMGYAIAEVALARGAEVTLVSGPVALPAPPGVRMVPVMTAAEMHSAVMREAARHDVVVKAAAVADFTITNPSAQKIKRASLTTMQLDLERTPDIVADLSALPNPPLIVAFAAETQLVEENAREKLAKKSVDIVVANDVSDRAIGFDSDHNRVTIVTRSGRTIEVALAPKKEIAMRILDVVAELIPERQPVA
jgi:phosphopantothenoylcysteine decarboxylase/phosphopantothenate--cysteine ligase